MDSLQFYDSDFQDLHYIYTLNLRRITQRHERKYQQRPDYFNDLSEVGFFNRFRMSKESFLRFFNEIEKYLIIKRRLIY
jgi:hypothetical protein